MKAEKDTIITAKQSRLAAKIFNYGTIASVLVPFPLFIFWFGASMFVYAMYRHHPNPRVGYYTQRAAYIYYTLAGLLVPVLTFAPKEFFTEYWWALWIVAAIGTIPPALLLIMKANKEDWKDTPISK